MHRVPTDWAAFTQSLAGGATLAQALDAAGAGLDFSAWLAAALRLHWLQRLETP